MTQVISPWVMNVPTFSNISLDSATSLKLHNHAVNSDPHCKYLQNIFALWMLNFLRTLMGKDVAGGGSSAGEGGTVRAAGTPGDLFHVLLFSVLVHKCLGFLTPWTLPLASVRSFNVLFLFGINYCLFACSFLLHQCLTIYI